MTDPLRTQPTELLDQLGAAICQDFKRGLLPAKIVAALVETGWTPAEAELALNRPEDIHRLDVQNQHVRKYARLDRERRDKAGRHAASGAISLVSGIVCSGGSYGTAARGQLA